MGSEKPQSGHGHGCIPPLCQSLALQLSDRDVRPCVLPSDAWLVGLTQKKIRRNTCQNTALKPRRHCYLWLGIMASPCDQKGARHPLSWGLSFCSHQSSVRFLRCLLQNGSAEGGPAHSECSANIVIRYGRCSQLSKAGFT